MNGADSIAGGRVRLRPATMADRAMIFRALARSELTDILLGHPSRDHTPLLSYEAFCADYKDHYFDGSRPDAGRCFVIEVDGEAVGQVNYNDIEFETLQTELDIWMFGERHCGRGYGTEAMALLCEALRRRFNVTTFYVKPSAANPRAIRAYEKIWFRRTTLSEAEAQREYGPKDDVDSVYMVLTLDRVVRGEGGGYLRE